MGISRTIITAMYTNVPETRRSGTFTELIQLYIIMLYVSLDVNK